MKLQRHECQAKKGKFKLKKKEGEREGEKDKTHGKQGEKRKTIKCNYH